MGNDMPLLKRQSFKVTLAACLLLIAGVVFFGFFSLLQKPRQVNSTAPVEHPKPREQIEYELRFAIVNQEDWVGEWSKLMRRIRHEEKVKPYIKAYVDIEREKLNLESIIRSFDRYEDVHRYAYAAEFALKDSRLRTIFSNYQAFMQDFGTAELKLKNDAEGHAILLKEKETLVSQLKDESFAIETAFRARLVQIKPELEHAYAVAGEHGAWDYAGHCGMRLPSYAEAQKECENGLARLAELKATLEQTEGILPSTAKP